MKMTPAKLREFEKMCCGSSYRDSIDDILISNALDGNREIELYEDEVTKTEIAALKKKCFKVKENVFEYGGKEVISKYVPSKKHKGYFERIDEKTEPEIERFWIISW